MKLKILIVASLFIIACANGKVEQITDNATGKTDKTTPKERKAPPYSGTIFVDPDIITSDDPSALESVTYTGKGKRTLWDRRDPRWANTKVYLFDVVWDDGLTSEAQVNLEFGSMEAAQAEAEKYAYVIGQMPHSLRVDVDAIWIHKGSQKYGGGNNSILVHTGRTSEYERDGILEEVMMHEGAHTSLDSRHASATGWLEAQKMDPAFISTYAQENPNIEDIAETFLLWWAVRYRPHVLSKEDYDKITQAIPNRIEYLNKQTFNFYPLMQSDSTDKAEIE